MAFPENQPGRNDSRTDRTGLSPLVSTRQTDCQVPSAMRPFSTGTDTDGEDERGDDAQRDEPAR